MKIKHILLFLLAFYLIGCSGGDSDELTPITLDQRNAFTEICAQTTSLTCADIAVDYKNLPSDVAAQAYMTNLGSLGIWFNEADKPFSKSHMKGLYVHELSHLVIFREDPTLPKHGERFREVCRGIANKVNVDVKEYCENERSH